MSNYTSQRNWPTHWWDPVSDPAKPYWEILPQEAMLDQGAVILSKRNELGVLSNFAHTPFQFKGKTYQSIEGLWQMMFYPDPDLTDDPRAQIDFPYTREQVSQMIGMEAQLAGKEGFTRMKMLGIDWVSFQGNKLKYWDPEMGPHYDLVVSAMKAKLEQNPRVAEILECTRGLRLLPDHYQPEDAPPSWKYYEIWMRFRDLN